MTVLSHLLSLDRILCDQEIQSKKRALEKSAELLFEDTQTSQINIYNCLLNREKLGSTALNKGVALPHGRVHDLVHPIISIITLKEGIDWEAMDQKPVDIIVSLLVPDEANETHLKIIASLAEFFSIDVNINEVRNTNSNEKIFQCISPFLPSE